MGRNLRVSLLEESKSPTQYAEDLGKHWKRISTALRGASFVRPQAKYQIDGHDVMFQAYTTGNLSVVNLVSYPETDDLDVRIIRNPSIVPEAVVSRFVSKDSGKTWVRNQTRFQFDDADSTRRVSNAIQDAVMDMIDKFRTAESKGAIMVDPNEATKGMKTVDKKPPKIVTGRAN